MRSDSPPLSNDDVENPQSARGNGQESVNESAQRVYRALAYGGTAGLILGGINGTLYSKTPALFTLASGAQWMVISGTFAVTRNFALAAIDDPECKSLTRRYIASGLAGAFSGGLTGLVLRGRGNVIPGMIIFSGGAVVGQKALDYADAYRQGEKGSPTGDSQHTKPALWRRLADSKYSPVTILSDEQYENILQERLLRVEADIAIIDDQIKDLEDRSNDEQDMKEK